MNNRTIKNLRESLKGKIYIYLENEQICKRFLQDAENEGYMFGKIKPTENGGDDIIALENKNQLSYVGFVGHMAFQCPSGVEGNFYRVDYKKYINGNNNFFVDENNQIHTSGFKGRFFDVVTVIGENCKKATEYLSTEISKCNSETEEDELYERTEKIFDIIILN